ncbi:MAG: sugar phosphate isomerase/epimerase family protein [Bacteroidia bacterium]
MEHTTKFSKNIICAYLYVISRYGYPPPAEHTLAYLDEMADMGFQSVELEGIRETHIREMYDLRFDIKAKLQERDLYIPYFCVVLPGLGADNAEIRKENLRRFAIGCETAHHIGASGVLDNAPLPPYHFPADIPVVRHYDREVIMAARLGPGLNWKTYWKDLIDTFREACDIAAAFGLSYHLHPCLGVLAATPDAFLYFADAVNRDNLRYNLDTANLFALQENPALALLRLAERIDYIHLSDCREGKMEHLPPGEGNISWDRFFDMIKSTGFNGHFGIDVGGAETAIDDIRNAYITSATWLKDRLI